MRRRGVGRRYYSHLLRRITTQRSIEIQMATNFKRSYYGTISFYARTFGLWVASTVIRELTQMQDYKSLKIKKKVPKSKK